MRFFYKMRTFTHEVAQKQCGQPRLPSQHLHRRPDPEGGHKEIVAIGSYAKEGDDRAEVAFVVREDCQGRGSARTSWSCSR